MNEQKPVVKDYLTTEKPVAWMNKEHWFPVTDDPEWDEDNWIPLYTKPTRRLTDDEMEQVFQEMWSKDNGFDVYFFAKAIENKLLEINK